MVNVTLLGSSGMVPLPDRPLSSMALMTDQCKLLVDCGEGTQCCMRGNRISLTTLDAVFITHAHSDHVLGLPGLLETMNNSDRVRPLLIVAPSNARKLIETHIDLLPQLKFSVLVYGIRDKEEEFLFENFSVTAFEVKHSTQCYGYTFELRRPAVYNQDLAACFGVDNAMAALLRSGYSIEKDGLLLTQEGVFGPSRKGIKVVYSTDTLPCQSLANQLTNADLAILEGMYWNTTPKNSKMYHSTCTESLQLAKARGVKEVWLTHFSPMFCNTGEAQQELREEYGDTITLGYSGLNRTLWFND